MRRALSSLLLLAACSSPPTVEQPAQPPEPPPIEKQAKPQIVEPWPHVVTIEGVETPAKWSDGDSFNMPAADGEKLKLRLAGYNTLESYGPVHRWGAWTGSELDAIAGQATELARSKAWACTITDDDGGYGRKVADCPDLRLEMLRTGLAHVFAVDEEPSPADLEAQRAAIEARVGMWAKGAPDGLVTSLHSLDEKEGQESTYNRVASLETGIAAKQEHTETYASCQEVCVGDAPPEGSGSCMLYVPYKQRYGDSKAGCLVVE